MQAFLFFLIHTALLLQENELWQSESVPEVQQASLRCTWNGEKYFFLVPFLTDLMMSHCSHLSHSSPILFCFSASSVPSWTTGALSPLHLSLLSLPNITWDLPAKFKYFWKREKKKRLKRLLSSCWSSGSWWLGCVVFQSRGCRQGAAFAPAAHQQLAASSATHALTGQAARAGQQNRPSFLPSGNITGDGEGVWGSWKRLWGPLLV